MAASATALAVTVSPPWEVYICEACGLLYDEREGDPDSGLPPGTRFADIPADWACPLCGVTKADFVPYQARDMRQAAMEHRAADRPPVPHPTSTAGMRSPGVVIVGAGRAGWQAAQALRERDPDLPITIVTGCSGDLYDKPLLSVAHARSIAPNALIKERASDAAARLRVHLMPQTHAIGLSPQAHRLRTTRGTLRYAKLIIALGAKPRALVSLPGALCWRINHLDAYLRLRSALGEEPRDIAIVGAGLVGCELANDLALAGHRITLLDAAATPMANWLPPTAGMALLGAWRTLSITFVGAVDITGTYADGTQKTLTTTCGRTFHADHVISATGLQADPALAASGGLAWNNGIAVDAATLATSQPDIHALGDCISIDGVVSRFIEPIGRQAQAIAAAITGIGDAAYTPRQSPLRVKTSSYGLRLEGVPSADGEWRLDTPMTVGGPLRMTQWRGEDVLARLTAG